MKVKVAGGEVDVRVFGAGAAPPLVALHGGPGIGADYLEMLEPLSVGRPVVLYDQLGCGRSPAPDDPQLWNLPRFISELAQVRVALEAEQLHLLGHSWGAMLALDYTLRFPEAVKSLVLDSPIVSAEKFRAGVRELREEGQTLEQFYARHVCRLSPHPESLQRSLAGMNGALYGTMWGPNELELLGTLAGYEREDRLAELELPVLWLVGEHDEVLPRHVRQWAGQVPGSRVHVFAGATHLKNLEAPDAYVEVVRAFLETEPRP